MRNMSLVLVSLAMTAAPVVAQQPAPRPAGDCPSLIIDGQVQPNSCNGTRPTRVDGVTPPPAEDPLARFLYPPELIMAHQEAIGLTERQRTAIQEAVHDAQSKLLDMQFRMSAEVEKLQRLIQATTPDEPKVLDEVNRVLTLERDVKVTQMTLMVRIKSQLTERQQGLLDQMRGAPSPKPAKE